MQTNHSYHVVLYYFYYWWCRFFVCELIKSDLQWALAAGCHATSVASNSASATGHSCWFCGQKLWSIGRAFACAQARVLRYNSCLSVHVFLGMFFTQLHTKYTHATLLWILWAKIMVNLLAHKLVCLGIFFCFLLLSSSVFRQVHTKICIRNISF